MAPNTSLRTWVEILCKPFFSSCCLWEISKSIISWKFPFFISFIISLFSYLFIFSFFILFFCVVASYLSFINHTFLLQLAPKANEEIGRVADPIGVVCCFLLAGDNSSIEQLLINVIRK